MEITRLRALTDAAVALNSTLSVENVLQLITEKARDIIGAHQAFTSAIEHQNWQQASQYVSLSEKYAAWRDYQTHLDGTGIYSLVCQTNQSIRMTQQELEAHPAWRGFGAEAPHHPPMRGWLAAPLMSPDGKNLGIIQLSDKYNGDFTEEDEIILMQFAQLASIALLNTRLYQEQVRAREEAEKANQLKLEFLAMISHELRTPLASIKGFATTLLSEDVSFDAESQREFIGIIDEEADNMVELVGQLLDLSRLQAGMLRIIPLRMKVREILDIAQPQLDSLTPHHTLVLDIADPMACVTADPGRVAQVLTNLVGNAVKYAPAHTDITIRATEQSGFIHFDVIDRGPGIPAEYHTIVFEAFRQIQRKDSSMRSGAGLGLAICKGIIEAQGGTIRIKDNDNDQPGTTVSFTLPLAPAHE